MNYFEHHIGDYDEATSHLSAREDGIYSRLIRKYYAKERPLPPDLAQVQRLARCSDDEDRAAVVAVLAEFFQLREDGYHQKTCDEVVERYQSGEPEREIKRANESTRLHRHREERSRLFQVLVSGGVHARWNIGMPELRKLVAEISAKNGGPATAHAGKTATTSNKPATASVTPRTATQSPIPNIKEKTPPLRGAPLETLSPVDKGARLPNDWAFPPAWGQWALKKYPHWTKEIVLDLALEFRNHWVAKKRDAEKLDWYATWQNWCMSLLTQRKYPPPRTNGADRVSLTEQAEDSKRQRVAEMTGGRANAPLRNHQQPILDLLDEPDIKRLG